MAIFVVYFSRVLNNSFSRNKARERKETERIKDMDKEKDTRKANEKELTPELILFQGSLKNNGFLFKDTRNKARERKKQKQNKEKKETRKKTNKLARRETPGNQLERD